MEKGLQKCAVISAVPLVGVCDFWKKHLTNLFWFFTLFCGIKIITYKIGIEKEHYLLQNVSCLKLRTEVE